MHPIQTAYNNGVQAGFAYGFVAALFLAVLIKAAKLITKNKSN